jgi:hypothetical protein
MLLGHYCGARVGKLAYQSITGRFADLQRQRPEPSGRIAGAQPYATGSAGQLDEPVDSPDCS